MEKGKQQFSISRRDYGDLDLAHIILFTTTKWADVQIKFTNGNSDPIISFEGFDAGVAVDWLKGFLEENETKFFISLPFGQRFVCSTCGA